MVFHNVWFDYLSQSRPLSRNKLDGGEGLNDAVEMKQWTLDFMRWSPDSKCWIPDSVSATWNRDLNR